MQQNNTYGLVICGGQSSRMGIDKSRIEYYGTEQRYHVYHLLQPFCGQVYISCNEQQSISVNREYMFAADEKKYAGCGPAAALLTAFELFPGKDLLVAGCDYPFLTRREMQMFVSMQKETAAAFYNKEASVYEPLLAWYTAGIADILKEMFTQGNYSLQQLLKTVNAAKYYPADVVVIKSVDTPEDYETAKRLLQQH